MRIRIANLPAWALTVVLVCCACCLLAMPSSSFADFGLNGVSAVARDRDGSVDLRAGSHPYEYTISFALNHDTAGNLEGTLRDLMVDLPPGLIGNPQAVPQCSDALFEGLGPSCPGDTQIGIVEVKAETLPVVFVAIYNLVPPQGVPASIGGSIFSVNSFQEATLRPTDYGIDISDITLPTNVKIQSVSETIWGTPADPGHDAQRECRNAEGGKIEGCASDIVPVPFLTLPTSCTGPLKTTLSADSVQEPGVFRSQTTESLDSGGNPAGLGGCEQPPFAPEVTAQLESGASDSPTGLHVDVHIPQNQDPAQLASAHLKNAVVTLPEGLVVNPSIADGLGACAQEGPEGINLPGSGEPGAREPAKCPSSAKIGTVQVSTPLLDHPLPGAVYVAKQDENPFHSLIALYIAVYDPITGVVVKIPGKVEPDPTTGRLTATFTNNPQLPFEDLELNLYGGPRAALTTPSTCGTFTTTSTLTPWTSPDGADANPSSSFHINTGANNAPCVSNEAQEPNAPSFEAGTTTPLAGTYSPLVLKLAREDGSQRLRALNVTFPPGLTGRLAGVAECSDAQLAQAAGRNQPGEGSIEQSNPSCSQSSEVGTVTTGAGSGSPLLVGGHAYLAGPYEGAPLSIAIIAPAVAGPFDLGTVVVRSGLFVDPNTAQVTVKSDPLPTILQGIPLDIRSVAIMIDRPQFTLNPTSCEPMSLTGEAISTQNQTASLSNRFQVGGCQALPFKPTMAISTQGKTSKANGASLTVKVSQKPGEANIHKVDLTLPKVLPARLTTLQQACTEAQFALNPAGCPAGSFIGTAKAVTPILGVPLTGPAILVSHGGAAFPDVVFLLQGNERGGTIRIDLDGKTDIKKGVTYSRFETVPDAPISSFETSLPEGPHSVLAATGNLCTGGKLAIPTSLTGQNGTQVNQNTSVTVTGCAKAKVLTRAQKLALALKACHKKPKGKKRTTCERGARKKYGPLKKAKKARKARTARS
jgi:hypothetical protein